MTDFTSLEYFKTYQTSAFKRMLRRFADRRYITLLKKYKKGGSLLDVGCGSGDLLKTANANGFVAMGLDVNPHLVKCAQKYARVKESTLENSGLPEKSFDAIVVLSVIQYVDDVTIFLSHCSRALKDDGILLLQTPEPYYTREQIERLLLNNGFDILHISTTKIGAKATTLVCKKHEPELVKR